MPSRAAERRKQRYAEDPVFREKVLATNSAWADKNREKINARQRLKYNTDPEHRARINAQSRQNRPRWVYGLPTEEYERMLAGQCGVCKICKKKYRKRLCIDHDHENGDVRGLLCNNCNAGLGFYKDNARLLREAAGYMDEAHDIPALRFLDVACSLIRRAAAVAMRLLPRSRPTPRYRVPVARKRRSSGATRRLPAPARAAVPLFHPLTRISHPTKCIGAPNRRKLLCSNDFRAIRGAPRCRQSVAQICSNLHPLRGAK